MCNSPRYVYSKEVHNHYIDYSITDTHDVDDNTGKLGVVIVKGSVKWDGCSNWNMQPDDVQIHFCSLEDMRSLNAVMEECYVDAESHFGFAD